MTITYPPPSEPPALVALRSYPLLLATVENSMLRQTAEIGTREQTFTGRGDTLARLHELLHSLTGGLVAVEGPPGSGVTTLLAHLAATRPVAFWFHDDDPRQGAAALAAQLIALYGGSIPLIPPAVHSDPLALEPALAEIAAHTSASGPLVVLLDPPACTLQPDTPRMAALFSHIPPNMLVVCGCKPGDTLPTRPVAHVALPDAGAEVAQDQRHLLQMMECPDPWIEPVISTAEGNMLYIRLSYGLLLRGLLTPDQLKPGLDFLHRVWWSRLDRFEQQLALLLAAAGEPIPIDLCSEMIGADAYRLLAAWSVIGFAVQFNPSHTYGPQPSNSIAVPTAAFAHWMTRDYLARYYSAELAEAHARLARQAFAALDLQALLPDGVDITDHVATAQDGKTYLSRQFARHAALGTAETKTILLPLVTRRDWVRMQERRSDSLAEAAHDLAWELHSAAASGLVVRLARSAALAGTLVSLARTLAPDAAVAALSEAIERYGRDAGLKRVRALVDQLPDVQSKALILRRLGEECYNLQMRTSAMRLLSQALDIEEQKQPASWREQREQLLAELAAATLNLGAVDSALQIGGRIGHVERRGMVETQVVQWLLAHNELTRASRIARRIDHESLGAWAQAEVAVALERAGDVAAAALLLSEVQSETARSWAEIELACDAAATDEEAARRRIDKLSTPHQHDRGLTRLARALALADKDGDALDAAGQIQDVAVRVSALLDLRLTLEGLVAMLALEQVNSVIGKLERDVRVPLVSLLAASYASLGRRDQAMQVAEQLDEGEERDRALSRVALALVQQGNRTEGLEIARALTDDDERNWTLDELVRELASVGLWSPARQLCAEIGTQEQQAHTMANLAIARARAGDPLAALDLAGSIALPAEYIRAVTIIAPLLVAAGQVERALSIAQPAATQPHILQPAQSSRYLAVVAAALAEQGHMEQSRMVTHDIARPLDRARARLALAYAAAASSPQESFAELALALQEALLGRDEAFRLLEEAVPTFATLGGAPLLLEVATVIDRLDSW